MIAKIKRASDYEKSEAEINSIADLETLYHEAKANTDSFQFHGLVVRFRDGEMHIVIYDDFLE